MNDFDYDCFQKKQLARNSKHRKGTVLGPKGCRLPHEYLTKKEREALNGELYSINLNKPLSWERFKTLTPSLQEEYLQHIMDRFGIGLSSISRDMFGMADTSLNTYAIRHNLKLNLSRGRRASKAAYERWHCWLDDPEPTLASAIEKHEEPVIEEPEDPSSRNPKSRSKMSSCSGGMTLHPRHPRPSKKAKTSTSTRRPT